MGANGVNKVGDNSVSVATGSKPAEPAANNGEKVKPVAKLVMIEVAAGEKESLATIKMVADAKAGRVNRLGGVMVQPGQKVRCGEAVAEWLCERGVFERAGQ